PRRCRFSRTRRRRGGWWPARRWRTGRPRFRFWPWRTRVREHDPAGKTFLHVWGFGIGRCSIFFDGTAGDKNPIYAEPPFGFSGRTTRHTEAREIDDHKLHSHIHGHTESQSI